MCNVKKIPLLLLFLATGALWPGQQLRGQVQMDVSIRLPDKSGKRVDRPQVGRMSDDGQVYYPGRDERSLSQMLEMHFPGVRCVGTTVYIRSRPCQCYLVDGVPFASLEGVDPLSVRSVSVITDVARTSVYGARGGNGVVAVETLVSR